MPKPPTNDDSTDSNGYEAIAAEFIAVRGTPSDTRPAVGVRTVREWAWTLRPGGAVLDLGCGSGYPMTQLLVDAGLAAHGVDASPSMVAAFRARFPDVPVECNDVLSSDFFAREFDGVIAWGLLFLLTPDSQAQLIDKVARALTPGSQFLFTAPRERCEWSDSMTGRPSVSLGAEDYRRLLENAGLALIDEMDDEGENHYYVAARSLSNA
jgi:SAM-dependent methyltransferase